MNKACSHLSSIKVGGGGGGGGGGGSIDFELTETYNI